MPTNIHSLAKHIRKLYLEKLQADLSDAGFQVAFKQGTSRTTNSVGIHLRVPTEVDILEASEQAMRDGFETIFIYAE
jgi:hypothetical protein